MNLLKVMGNEPVTDNPYQSPQSDLRQDRASPVLQPLTDEIGTRFGITIVASSVIIWAVHVVAAEFLASEYLTAQHGDVSWQQHLTAAALHGFSYGYFFTLSLLGSIWYFCKNQVHLPALWSQYFYLLGIMLAAWLCGGILGYISHTRGWHAWYESLPNASFQSKMLLGQSPQAAWFLVAETITEIVGAISLVAFPVLFTIRNRKRVAIESQKAATKKP